MKKNTFFSIISTRQRMHTYLGSNFQDFLSMSEIIGAGPVKRRDPHNFTYRQGLRRKKTWISIHAIACREHEKKGDIGDFCQKSDFKI